MQLGLMGRASLPRGAVRDVRAVRTRPGSERCAFASAHVLARVAENPQPRSVFAPIRRVPRVADGAENAFGMGHEYGKAAVGRGEPGDAAWRSVRVVRVILGRTPVVVDVTQGEERPCRFERRNIGELRVTFTVR